MKAVSVSLVLAAALLAGIVVSPPAVAGGGPRVGVSIGWGYVPRYYPYYWGPRYYYPPPVYYYPPPAYYPPAVYAPAAPPVYVEKDEAPAAPAPQQSQWWYYCRGANAYYPYVRECPEGWQRVPPQPPPG